MVLVLFIVYGASLSNHFVRWDDGLLIYENPAIRSITPSTLKTIFTSYDPELYIPLTFFSYQIDYLIGGTNPVIYHAQNLLWHTLNALLVTWLAYLLSRKKWAAFFCGVLFAVHPLHTEAVAWASARKDVLSAFFFLGSLIAYLYQREYRSTKLYLLSLSTFLLGLLAKVTVLTLPLILLLSDMRARRKWSWAMLLEKLPFFALSITFGIVAWVGKTGVLEASTPSEKILLPAKSIAFSLQKIFIPWNLSVLYPFAGDVTLARVDILIPFIFLLLLIAIALLSLLWTREVFFGIGFFLLTLSPTLLNFAKGDVLYFASDRYAYIPSLGIFLLLGIALSRTCERKERHANICVGFVGLIAVTFAVLSSLQSRAWHDSTSLFTHALSIYPRSHVALNNLGNVSRTAGDATKAIENYTQALSIVEQEGRAGPGLQKSKSKILSNLASAEREQGNLQKAQETYQRALSLDPTNTTAHLGLGIIAGLQGNAIEAETRYRSAIASSPEFATAHLNLGTLLVNTGRLTEGIAEYRAALALNPFYPQAHFNLGVALQKTGDSTGAIASYREAATLQSTFTAAHINLGILLFNAGNREGAASEFEAVLQYDPRNAQARAALQQIQHSP
jgi:tetratricopeptide (TPR) repeat protein